ncbi:MAG: hypothetical protein Q6M54_09695 [Thermostichus sp. DRC_bins_24]
MYRSYLVVFGVTILSLCYHEIRAHFGLSSNLAQQVCRRVAGPRKVAKQKHRPVKAVKSDFLVSGKRPDGSPEPGEHSFTHHR